MKIKILFIFFLCFSMASAQKVLTLDEMINIILKNNYDIYIARNESDIARLNNSAGNAGMLPDLSFKASASIDNSNILQTHPQAPDTKYPNMTSNSIAASVNLNWTLFDGGKMFISKNKLNELQAIGELNYKNQVLNTVFQAVSIFYDIIRQQQQLKAINEIIVFNQNRTLIAQTAFDAGTRAKTDLLQAKMDLNLAKQNALSQENLIKSQKIELNKLMVLSTDNNFDINDSISDINIPEYRELEEKLLNSNLNLILLKKQLELAKLIKDEIESSRLPFINLSGAYNFSSLNNSDGNLKSNREYGPQLAVGLSIPIYSAGEISRKSEIASIDIKSNEYNLEAAKLELKLQLQNSLSELEFRKQQLIIEQENNLLAKENIEISLERLRLGEATSLEVHLAQDEYAQSTARLINFKYYMKTLETKIKQLIAEL